jgi:hypothetical protein
MFRQLVTPSGPPGPLTPAVLNNINSLFVYHPLQISALVETVWLNRLNAGTPETGAPFLPWSPQIAVNLLNTPFFPGYDWSGGAPVPLPPGGGVIAPPTNFTLPINQPGVANTWDGIAPFPPAGFQPTNWDHMIYAYLIENTRIFEIFSKVLETYMFGEQLETPSPVSQQFWRNLEFLIFGDAMPSMVWTTSGRLRRNEIANRMTSYYWMFGIDLSHAADLAGQNPYQKPAASNRDFIPTFESFAREVWRGVVNAKNTSGANDTDSTVIATLARRLYDMMATRRINGNLSREEFRAVAIMSYMHLAILFDSPAVVDLKAAASSPEMRLKKMGERVGIQTHMKAKPFLDLAGPFSILMQSIETGSFNTATGAELLYFPTGTAVAQNAEDVIDQYSLATGRELKAQAISITPRPAVAASSALAKRQGPPPAQLASAKQVNGQARPGQ